MLRALLGPYHAIHLARHVVTGLLSRSLRSPKSGASCCELCSSRMRIRERARIHATANPTVPITPIFAAPNSRAIAAALSCGSMGL